MDITIGGITYHALIPEWDDLRVDIDELLARTVRIEEKLDKLIGEDDKQVQVVFRVGPVTDQKE